MNNKIKEVAKKTMGNKPLTKIKKQKISELSTKSPLEQWDKILTSSVTDNLKEGMQNCMNEFNTTLSKVNSKAIPTSNMTKDIVNNFSHNIRNNFEENMELAQEILKCKTAADFIEFQRKSFETNYKNTMKICSDLLHDLQSLITHSLKDGIKYASKE